MYHISDLKKFNRCPRLYVKDNTSEKPEFRQYVRLDEQVTDLAAKKLGVTEHFLGERGDDEQLALNALQQYNWIVKGRFSYHGLRVKVPFLHRVGDAWDLYFLFIGLYPHADDMQFYCDTVWVLEGLGLKLNHIYMIHLNANYVREDELDIDQLFIVSDCFYNNKNNPSVRIKDAIYSHMKDVDDIIQQMNALEDGEIPAAIRSNKCTGRQKCRWYEDCFEKQEDIPCNSILTLVGCAKRFDMKKEGRLYLKNADETRIEGSPIQYAQILADQNGGLFADKIALNAWLKDITYPITFIDFEWERYAIPPYVGMKPYDVLPFEYSIHILQEDGTLTHKVFLSKHDDRKEMIENMIHDIPSTGSLMAYNAEGAEMIRIEEFAQQFPEYADSLRHMNARMKDLQNPFIHGMVYDTRLAGAMSLKNIMNIMDDKNYSDLEINHGMDAVYQWRYLDRDDPTVDSEEIIKELKEYCGMDTYAMTVVFDWLKQMIQ